MDADRWARVEKIFHQAARLAGADRSAFLERECGGDRALLAEVESLLTDEPDTTFLDQPAIAVAARLVVDEAAMPPGRRFGPYRIDGLIGSGGMGDVYRAHDTVLGRDVAIKMLPDAFKDDPERLARFEQEAQFLASLSHPHVAAIYGVHESGGVRGLVLELVDGETLAERISRGPLPLHDVVRIARQIGEGLDAAHQRGIVHRDLKPANVKIARDGTTKVLDFGIAKSVAADRPNSKSAPLETPGQVVGTASYMSPEQARGDVVDKRTDIWAFGCVCFEMLTGRPAFRRTLRSADATMASDSVPRWDLIPASVPRGVIDLLQRCLEEDPKRRRRDIGDVLVDLDDALQSRPAAPPVASYRWLALTALAALIVVTVLLLNSGGRAGPDPSSLRRLSLLIPSGMQFPEKTSQLAVSSDGRMVAYVAAAGGQAPRLILRRLGTNTDQVIEEAKDPRHPFFSPDNQWIGYFSGDAVMRISVANRLFQQLTRVDRAETGSWANGVLLFGTGGDLALDGIRQVSESTGPVTVLTRPNRAEGELNHFAPELLPDGRTLMYSARRPYGPYPSARIMAQRPGEPPRVVLDDAHSGRYLGNSILLYQQGQALFATHFDPNTLVVSGRGELLLDDVATDGRPGWAAGGDVLVYRSLLYRTQNDNRQLVWVDRKGVEAAIPAPPRRYGAPNLAPSRDVMAVEIEEDAKYDIWTVEAGRGTLRQITSDGASRYPLWSPRDDRIGVVRRRSPEQLSWRLPDGRAVGDIIPGKGPIFFGSWTPDGRTLLYMEETKDSKSDIWAVNLDAKTPPRPVVQTNAREYGGRLSPDGKWVAYFSDSGTNQFQLYLTPFDGNGPEIPISRPDDRGRPREAVWGRDARDLELFYRQGSEMLAVRIGPDGRPRREATRLFERDYFSIGGPAIVHFDVAADGRFLMVKPLENQTPNLSVVVGLDGLIRERLQPIAR
jgi:serine/threonine protein kinase/Tol biopolymer transport system component